jgi:predicted nucleotidyltransferase
MQIVGLITEYNPFHNGHLHHLQESLRATGADASVAVMSGSFLQRGEPALVDKWVRTRMALAAGVDVVLELPFPFACNSAPHFAMGAVQSLDALGIIDALCFGSEAGDIAGLMNVASVLVEKADEIEAGTVRKLRDGLSYPAARAEVVVALAPGADAELLASPNNILGVEYLKALRMIGSNIQGQTIMRQGPGYHSTDTVGQIASATGIRQLLGQGEDIGSYLPEPCRTAFMDVLAAGHTLDNERLFTVLQAQLLQESASLEPIYQVEHGLDRRLAEAALSAQDVTGLVDATKSRQWTRTRIQRILCYVLMQAVQEEMQSFLASGPLYLRLLGVSEQGRRCLARARSRRCLPMISDPSRATTTLGRFYRDQSEKRVLAEQMLAYDLRATRLHGLMMKQSPGGHWNRDYFEPVQGGG